MSSFERDVLERQRITPALARTMRELGEFKGRQALHRRQSPQVLQRLLEALVEDTKDSYYDALHRSSQGWHESEHSLLPWWEYLLGVVLLPASADFERRVGVITDRRGAKRQMVIDAVERLPRQFQFKDIERLLPSTSRPTINRVLAELRKSGRISCVRPGRTALWEKT